VNVASGGNESTGGAIACGIAVGRPLSGEGEGLAGASVRDGDGESVGPLGELL
jgi:hypothetical protein